MISTIIGIALSSPGFGVTDFGQIHFLGSVLYSGCYVQAINQQYRPDETTLPSKVNHFDLNFSYCRLIDNGKVLAEIAIVNPQQIDFQLYLKNAGQYQLVKKDLHQILVNHHVMNLTPTGQSQLKIQTHSSLPYFDSKTNKTFDIELIYR